MNILYLTHRIPYPPNKGDKIRSFHELKFLSTLGNVYLGALVDNLDDMKHEQDLKQWCRKIFLFPISPAKKKFLALKGFWNGTAMSVHYFYEPALQRAIDHLTTTNDFHLVFCFSSPMAEYLFRSSSNLVFKKSPPPLFVMDFCDVDSVKWKEYSEISRWPLSQIYKQESILLSQYENKVARFFDYSIFVSDRERSLFKELNPDISQTYTISNGIDLDYFQPSNHVSRLKKDSPTLVFTGAMDYYANIDGVCWFIKEIWPQIKREVPEVVFYIVGANPSSKIRQFHDGRNIIVTGYVPEIRYYYSLATVCIVPLRIARGIQNKVLEAMAMARPVVCTPNAFEGINAHPGRDLLIASTPGQFSRSVIELLKNRKERKRVGSCARQQMERFYSWDIQLKPLKTICNNIPY